MKRSSFGFLALEVKTSKFDLLLNAIVSVAGQHVCAVVSVITSQQEGSRFEPASRLAPFFSARVDLVSWLL